MFGCCVSVFVSVGRPEVAGKVSMLTVAKLGSNMEPAQ